MAADGDEIDERAERALAALREGRPVPRPGGAAGWGARLETLATRLGLDGGRLVAGALLVVGAIALGGAAWLVLGRGPTPAPDDDALFAAPATTSVPAEASPGATTTTTAPVIVVHAAGGVHRAGLYRLPQGSRVADLLDAAGGTTAEADTDRLNLATPLVDGQRLYVPRRGEVAPSAVGPEGGGTGPGGGGGAVGATAGAGPVDLNAATAEQLDALPGVGPATASAIVAHRERNGPFATVDDLLDVRGIGPSKLEGLRDLVTVG